MAGNSSRIQFGDVQQTTKCPICQNPFTDPRGLTCSHTFCLTCLEALQTHTPTRLCPVCKQSTVPSRAELSSLPVNQLAVELVNLIQRFDPANTTRAQSGAASGRSSPPLGVSTTAVQASEETEEPVTPHQQIQAYRRHHEVNHQAQATARSHSEMNELVGGFGPLTSHNPQLHGSGVASYENERHRGFRSPPGLNRQLPVVGMQSAPNNSNQRLARNAGSNIHTIQEYRPAVGTRPGMAHWLDPGTFPLRNTDPQGRTHRPYQCRICRTGENIRGPRFQCGNCSDYHVCRDCIVDIGAFHDASHLFVKIKTPGWCDRTTSGRQDIDELRLRMSTDRVSHVLELRSGYFVNIQCDRCGTQPITGIRYKCAVCADYDICSECERTSENFHPTHPFIRIERPVARHADRPMFIFNPDGEFPNAHYTAPAGVEVGPMIPPEDPYGEEWEIDGNASNRRLPAYPEEDVFGAEVDEVLRIMRLMESNDRGTGHLDRGRLECG